MNDHLGGVASADWSTEMRCLPSWPSERLACQACLARSAVNVKGVFTTIGDPFIPPAVALPLHALPRLFVRLPDSAQEHKQTIGL